jgi:hypothetical protein
MLGSDYCMNPTDNTIQIIPTNTQEFASFYFTCVGLNPIEEPLEIAYNYTNGLNQSIYLLTNPGGPCPGDTDILSLTEEVNNMYSSLDIISVTADCPPIKAQWNDVSDATCESIFDGALYLWSGQYVTAAAFFVLIVLASICYSFFDMWFTDEDASPINTGQQSSRDVSLTPSSSFTDSSNNIFSNTPQIQGGEKISYGNTFLYDDVKDDVKGTEGRRFVF